MNENGGNPESVARFLKDKAAMAKLEGSYKLDGISPSSYSAVFLPGGHGTMWDLPKSNELAALLSNAWAAGKVVAAVCHVITSYSIHYTKLYESIKSITKNK